MNETISLAERTALLKNLNCLFTLGNDSLGKVYPREINYDWNSKMSKQWKPSIKFIS